MFSNLFYWHNVSAKDSAWHSFFWTMGVWLVACSGGGTCAWCFSNLSLCIVFARVLCTGRAQKTWLCNVKQMVLFGCFMFYLSHSLCYLTEIEVGRLLSKFTVLNCSRVDFNLQECCSWFLLCSCCRSLICVSMLVSDFYEDAFGRWSAVWNRTEKFLYSGITIIRLSEDHAKSSYNPCVV